MLPKLTSLHWEMLQATAKYGFMTTSLYVLAGFGKPDTLRKAASFLTRYPEKSPLFLVKKFPVHARMGRREHVFSLSDHGHQLLGDRASEYPRLVPHFDADFYHRRTTVACHILIDRNLPDGCQLERWETYFHNLGANHRLCKGQPLTAVTKVHFCDHSFFVPDALFQINTSKGHILQYAVEIIMGANKNRILHQIGSHIKALSEGAVAHKFGRSQNYTVLFLYKDEGLMKRVARTCLKLEEFPAFHECFLFNHWDAFSEKPLHSWRITSSNLFVHLFRPNPHEST